MDETTPPPRRIDVVSDAICPWCWVGKRNLEGALARLAAEGEGFEVHWRPFQLNPDMPRAGMERAAYRAAGPQAVQGFRQVLEAMMDPEMRRHFEASERAERAGRG